MQNIKFPIDWEYVSKEELLEFIKNYPYKLERDFFMDWYSWNDFRDGRVWPESMVAMASAYDDEFKIRKYETETRKENDEKQKQEVEK